MAQRSAARQNKTFIVHLLAQKHKNNHMIIKVFNQYMPTLNTYIGMPSVPSC